LVFRTVSGNFRGVSRLFDNSKGFFMRFKMLPACGMAGLAAAALLMTTVAPASATTAGPGQGSAYGADAHVSLLPGVLGPSGLTVATGELAAASTSGPNSASAVDAALKGLVSAKVISGSSRYDASTGDVTSKASIVHAAIPVLASVAGTTPTASVISSECTSTSSGITGSSDLADLNLGSLGHVSAATPNLDIDVPGVLRIVANEQIHNADGSLTVNALHITLLGGQVTKALGSGDIVLASSTCGPATPVSVTTSTPPTTTPGGGNTGSNGGGSQVSAIPSGAPETGDGSLASVVVG
jgi:hypothetical protein